MTVASSLAYKAYSGNDVTTAFPTTYAFFDNTDLVVTLVDEDGVETTKTLTTHYTVSGGDGATGTVTMLTAPATGETLIIRRSVPYTQGADYISNDAFPAETHEEALDKLTMLVQQVAGRVLSAPGLPSTFDPNTETAPTLPLPETGKVLIGNADETGWESAEIVDLVDVDGIPVSIVSLAAGDLLRYNGAAWANVATLEESNLADRSVPLIKQATALTDPGHRLSLTTGLAVTTSDVTAATTVYLTPKVNNIAPMWNGTLWVNFVQAQLSYILDTSNHLANNNYDFFLQYNGGTPRLVTGPAWTNATTRSGALGVDDTYGRAVNNASMTVRLSNNGGAVTLPAKNGLYVGTIRCSANGQTEDSLAKRYVWNTYHRVPRAMRAALETTDSWSYATATIRQANNNAANQLDFVRGQDEDAVEAVAMARWANDTLAGAGITLIGLDSTSAAAAGCIMVGASAGEANQIVFSSASWTGVPGLGRHTLTWLERGNGTGAQTWSGDGASPTFIQSGISGWGMA